MKAKITYVSRTHFGNGPETWFEEINTLEDIIKLRDSEGHPIIISNQKPIDADIEIEIFDDYYE